MLLYASLTFKHVEPGFQKERFFPPLVTDENLEVAANEEGAPSQAWEGHQECMVMFCSIGRWRMNLGPFGGRFARTSFARQLRMGS